MKTVKKVIDILEAFEKPQAEKSIPELVGLSGLNTSTVYRICSELMERGYLAKKNRGKYCLGKRFVKFYDSMSEITRLKNIALVFMQRLSKEINESIALSFLAGGEITDLAAVVSAHKLQLIPREGENLPLHCTSAGKIFLSQMDSDYLGRIITTKGLPARTTNTITNLVVLRKELIAIRREGIAFDNEEFELGIRSVAAQVKGKEGLVIAALAVVGPSVRISINRMRDLVPVVRACAQEISLVMENQEVN